MLAWHSILLVDEVGVMLIDIPGTSTKLVEPVDCTAVLDTCLTCNTLPSPGVVLPSALSTILLPDDDGFFKLVVTKSSMRKL